VTTVASCAVLVVALAVTAGWAAGARIHGADTHAEAVDLPAPATSTAPVERQSAPSPRPPVPIPAPEPGPEPTQTLATAPPAPAPVAARPAPAAVRPAPVVAKCPTGDVLVTGPTGQSVEPDAAGVQLRANLHMEDQGVPAAQTFNHVTWTGGTVVNRTNVAVKVITMPTVFGLDAGKSRLVQSEGSVTGGTDMIIAPGATVAWTGYGSEVFARASLVGFGLLPNASVWWSAYPEGPSCASRPTVTY
jgi:hypothetical protein